jgi:hypothetical protein
MVEMIWLKVDRFVGLCAMCGLPSEPVFCNQKCEDDYLEWRMNEVEGGLRSSHPLKSSKRKKVE